MWEMRRLILFLCVASGIFLSSCKTIYKPIETVRYDTLYKSIFTFDTLIERDTLREIKKGDTIEREKTKYVYKVKVKYDTLIETKIDTVVKIKEIPQQPTKKEIFYQFIGQWIFWILLVLLFCYCSYKVIWKKIKKS